MHDVATYPGSWPESQRESNDAAFPKHRAIKDISSLHLPQFQISYSCLMSPPALSKAPPKRPRQPGQDQESPRPHTKRPKRSASTYWDNLSKIWLTKDALEELCRRNNIQEKTHSRSYERRQPAPPPKPKERFVTDLLRDSSAEYINAVKKFSKSGGPDLTDLRNVIGSPL